MVSLILELAPILTNVKGLKTNYALAHAKISPEATPANAQVDINLEVMDEYV